MIEDLKKDNERLNQMLISKDMDNQNLKQALNALQQEMMSLQSELEVLNQYASMKKEALGNKSFNSHQIMRAYQNIQDLLEKQFMPQDVVREEIEVDDIQEMLDNQNLSLIYDSEIQFTLLRVESKLRRLYLYMNPPIEERNHALQRQSRMGHLYQSVQQQQPYSSLNDNLLNRQQLKISNLIIQNHAGVQENNKIININTNSVICNKENQDMNKIMLPTQSSRAGMHT